MMDQQFDEELPPGSRIFKWITVTVCRTFDAYKHSLYKVNFQTKNQLEWGVKYRFKIYRDLYTELSELDVLLDSPFPPTYLRSFFGIQLSEELLQHRTQLLTEWILELFEKYETLSAAARSRLSATFDESQKESESKCLETIYSYLDYMSNTYKARPREPMMDLVQRFKLDLEQARTSPLKIDAMASKSPYGSNVTDAESTSASAKDNDGSLLTAVDIVVEGSSDSFRSTVV